MPNVLDAVQPVLFAAARVVPRELTGFIAAVSRDFNDQGVAKGDVVKTTVAPIQTATDVVPGATFGSGADRTPSTINLQLNNFKETHFNLNAEQERSLLNGGVLAADFLAQSIQQGIRALVNPIEAYLANLAALKASRAYGTPGTAPFSSTVADLANAIKILKDNGVVDGGLRAVINTTTEVNLRTLPNLLKANEAGSTDLLRQGILTNLFRTDLYVTGQSKTVTKGTGANYTTTAAGFAVGTVSIPLITGTGTVNAGDVITIAGDANKYVVAAGIAAPGTITLQEPGLMQAIPAVATAVSVGNSYTANSVFDPNAIKLVVRPALQPEGAAFEQQVISDPVTGLSFLMIRVPQNAQTTWFMRVVYDAFVPNPYALATLLG
jgi:hypothetical protein